VEPGDVFSDYMEVSGPEAQMGLVRITHRREVVGEGIQPHVDDVVLVLGPGHPPGEAGSGHGDVFQPPLQDLPYLVPPDVGEDELGALVQEIQKGLRVPRKAEEPVLLLHPLDLEGGVDRTSGEVFLALLQFIPGLVSLATHALVAGVGTLVEVAVGLDTPDDLLDPPVMPILGGSDEIVVADVQDVPGLEEFLGDVIHPLLGADTGFLGALEDFLTVLVHPDDEVDCFTLPAMVPGHDVGTDLLDGVAEMG
jgi:hypothetical protein